MWVCGLQRFYFLFVGLHSVFTWLSGYHFFVCWHVVGCLGQHLCCSLTIMAVGECLCLLVVVVGVVCENCIVDASICAHDAAFVVLCVL